MCQHVDMVASTITNYGQKICCAEDMGLRPYSADNLIKARQEKGWSQNRLAEESGVSVSMISKLEQSAAREAGKNPISPTAEVLSKLGKALDIYFAVVWGEVDENSQIIFRNKKSSDE